MTDRGGTGLANSAAPWTEGYRTPDPVPDPLTNDQGAVGLLQRAGRPLGTVEQTNDVQRPARRDLTYYLASRDGSAVQPFNGLHGVIGDRYDAAHEGESERPWDHNVTLARRAPEFGWDVGAELVAATPSMFRF